MDKKIKKGIIDVQNEIEKLYTKLDEVGGIMQGVVEDFDELVETSSRKPLFKGLKKKERHELASKLLREKQPKLAKIVDGLYEYAQCLNQVVEKVEDELNDTENKLDDMEQQIEELEERREEIQSKASMLS